MAFGVRSRLHRHAFEVRIRAINGSGVACFDYDLDGAVDLYLGQGCSNPPHEVSRQSNAMFRQIDGRFQLTTALANVEDFHYSTGITAGDWNQDGFPDLIVGNLGLNRLFVNQGDGTFRESLIPGNWSSNDYTMSLAVADLTGNGLSDLVAVNYLDDERIFAPIVHDKNGRPLILPGPLHFAPAKDRVWIPLGDGNWKEQTFANMAANGDVSESASTGRGLLITNINDEVTNDVFIANDLRPNHFGNGTRTAIGLTLRCCVGSPTVSPVNQWLVWELPPLTLTAMDGVTCTSLTLKINGLITICRKQQDRSSTQW